MMREEVVACGNGSKRAALAVDPFVPYNTSTHILQLHRQVPCSTELHKASRKSGHTRVTKRLAVADNQSPSRSTCPTAQLVLFLTPLYALPPTTTHREGQKGGVTTLEPLRSPRTAATPIVATTQQTATAAAAAAVPPPHLFFTPVAPTGTPLLPPPLPGRCHSFLLFLQA